MSQQSTAAGGSGPRVIVIGGVAGGASAAARLRRLLENADILMVERSGYVSFANCGLPYHIGEVIAERKKLLLQSPESFRNRYNIEARVRTEAVAIDRQAKEAVLRDLADGTETREHYDYLVLSPGAAPVRPPIQGIDLPGVYTLRNIGDMDAIKAAVDGAIANGRPPRALIVGGGYIGLEMAEALRMRNVPTVLVEMLKQVMGPVDPEMAVPLHEELRAHGVDLRLGTQVTALKPEGDALAASLGDGTSVPADMVIMAIGVKPEVKLAKEAGLTIGERGGIVVDEQMRTNDPAIFAVGDAVEVQDFVTGAAALIPLAGPANRQGRIAADAIAGRTSAYRKTQGTAICKVFEQAIGITGASEKALKRAAKNYQKVFVHAGSHAGYYPGAETITLKLLFDPADGKLLGAQAVGKDGVDKRIDVLATALRAGMTVYDLEHLELSYAPPYGSAKDPINMAGFVAANYLRGDMPMAQAEELVTPPPGSVVLDVRSAKEFEGGHVPGALNVPVDDLRSRLGELPRDKEFLVHCQVGFRSYLATRILLQNGFKARNVTGAYKSYLMVKEAGV